MAKINYARNLCAVLESITIASALYGLLYMTVLVFHGGVLPKSPADFYKHPASSPSSGGSSSDSDGAPNGVVPLPSSKLHVEKINVNANWFNRPKSLVVPKDDYLGKRPHVDTIANLTCLVEECRGSFENIEKMPYVQDCLKYLETGEHEYYYTTNTAIMSLTANSSPSSYLLRGGVRMGLNFHPRIIGVMAVKDHRNQEFHMLETAAFDPIWTEFNWDRLGRCTVPCIHDYGQVFKSKSAFPLHNEWECYDGQPLKAKSASSSHFWELRSIEEREMKALDKDATVEVFDRNLLS